MKAVVVSKIGDMVQVNTAVGDIQGVWCSPIPADFKSYVLELDSDEILTVESIRLSDCHEPFARCEKNVICLNGVIEEIENGVAVFRLLDSLMMLELEVSNNFDYSVFLNRFVCITLHTISFFDTELDT